MRRNQGAATESLLSSIEWHALGRQTAEQGAAPWSGRAQNSTMACQKAHIAEKTDHFRAKN